MREREVRMNEKDDKERRVEVIEIDIGRNYLMNRWMNGKSVSPSHELWKIYFSFAPSTLASVSLLLFLLFYFIIFFFFSVALAICYKLQAKQIQLSIFVSLPVYWTFAIWMFKIIWPRIVSIVSQISFNPTILKVLWK